MRTIDWKSNKPTPTPSVLGSGQKVLIPQLSKRATGGSTPNSWNNERKTSRTIEHWTNRMSQSLKYSAVVNNENVPQKQKTAAPLLQQKNNGAMQTIQPRSAWISPEKMTKEEDNPREGTSKDQSATPVSSNVNENLSKPSRMVEREMTVSSCSSASSAPSKIKDAFMDMRAEDISSLGSLLGSPKPDTAKSMAPQSKEAVVRSKAVNAPLLGSLLSTPLLDTTPSTLLEHTSLTDKAKDSHQNEKHILQSSYSTRTKELERSATRVLARDSTEKSKVLLRKADKLLEQAISVIRSSSSRSSFNEDSRRNERNMITSTILELDAIQNAFEKKSSTSTPEQDKSPCTATTASSCRCGVLYEYPDPGLYLSQISVDVESPNSDESPLQPFPKRRLDYFNTDKPLALKETRSESNLMKATSATQNSFLLDAIQLKQPTYYDGKNVSPSQQKADSPSLLGTLREYNQTQGQSRRQLKADSPSALLGTLREYNQSREHQAQLKPDSSSRLGTLREYNQTRDKRQGNSLKGRIRDEISNSLTKDRSFRFSGHDSLSTLSEGSAVDRNNMGANHPGLGPHVVRLAVLGGSQSSDSGRTQHRREHAASTQRPRSKSTPRSFPVERQEARNKTVRFGGPNGNYVIHEEPEPKSCLATMFSRAENIKERKDPHQRALQHSEVKPCVVLPNDESNLYKNQSKKMISRGAAASPTSIFNYPALPLQEHYIRVEDTGRETPQ